MSDPSITLTVRIYHGGEVVGIEHYVAPMCVAGLLRCVTKRTL